MIILSIFSFVVAWQGVARVEEWYLENLQEIPVIIQTEFGWPGITDRPMHLKSGLPPIARECFSRAYKFRKKERKKERKREGM